MSGYEKVSFLKFEAAGENWFTTGWYVGDTPMQSWVFVRLLDDASICGRVRPDSGSWTECFGMRTEEQIAIVDYLRANPLPGDGE